MTQYSVGESRPPLVHPLEDDVRRHRGRVTEALRENLAEMVMSDRIWVTRGAETVAVPLETLTEFRIRFEAPPSRTVTMRGASPGEGEAEAPEREGGARSGGSGPGHEVTEATFRVEEVVRALFEDLTLPDWDPTRSAPGGGDEDGPTDLARSGPRSRWAWRATLRANLLRRAPAGDRRVGTLEPEDLRFYREGRQPGESGGAVVLALMDTSGSMGSFEKYLAKTFFFWTVAFLRRRHPRVEVVFIAHDVRAREVDEDTFFHRGSSGGTVSSSAYRLALDLLATRYPRPRYNAYVFHFSDGGNLTSDNPSAVALGLRLAEVVNRFGYGEIHDTERQPSPLFQGFRAAGVQALLLRRPEDVADALRRFLAEGTEGYGAPYAGRL